MGMNIPGQGPEGHLVLDFKTEVGPPVQIPKTMVILTKIAVFNEKGPLIHLCPDRFI